MTSGIAAPWAVYGIEASSWGGTAVLKRFFGCAFPVDAAGHLASCRHVLSGDLEPDEMLVAQHPTQDKCFRVDDVRAHREWDFAIASCHSPTLNTVLWTPELNLGDDVFAYGYYDWSAQNGQLRIVPQVHKGHVTATPRLDVGLCRIPLPWVQVSFATPPGFSGSALYYEVGDGCVVAGMIVESISTEVGGIQMAFGKAMSGLGIQRLARELGVSLSG